MSSSAAELPAGFTLLVVGTANVCRSPLAERIGAAYLDEFLGADVEATFRIVSAGAEAVAGHEMTPDSALVLSGLGGDPAKFWAGKLSPELAGSADLTLAMTRQHREKVLELAPRALARTFTLLEAADLLTAVDWVGGPDEIPVPDRARSVVRAMAAARAGRRSSGDDDIPDPTGRSVKVHQEVAEVIADAMLIILGRLVGADTEVRSLATRAAHAERAPRHRWPLRS